MRFLYFFCLLIFFFQNAFSQDKHIATVKRFSQTNLFDKDSTAYSYNAQGKKIAEVTFKMNGSTKQWENYSMRLYTENTEMGFVEIYYRWDKDWKKIEKSQTKSMLNPASTVIERFAWNDYTNDWIKSSKSIFIIDSVAHTNLSQDWRYFEGTNKWEKYSETSVKETYLNGNKISYEKNYCAGCESGSAYYEGQKQEFAYDMEGRKLSEIYFIKKGQDDVWILEMKAVYNYIKENFGQFTHKQTIKSIKISL